MNYVREYLSAMLGGAPMAAQVLQVMQAFSHHFPEDQVREVCAQEQQLRQLFRDKLAGEFWGPLSWPKHRKHVLAQLAHSWLGEHLWGIVQHLTRLQKECR